MKARIACAVFMLSSVLAAADFTGTWKLNTAKSKYTGMPTPKEMTVVYTPQGSGWTYEAKGVNGEGQPVQSSFTYVKDGDDIQLQNSPFGDTLVLKNASGTVATGTFKRGGKAVGSVKRRLSADGKTMTLEGSTTSADGKKINYTAVYEKQ